MKQKIKFKWTFLLLTASFFLTAFFVFQKERVSGKSIEHLLINELQYQDGENNGHDFIEMYNPTSEDVDLSGFNLYKMTSTGKAYSIKSPIASKGTILKSKAFYVWASTTDKEYPKSIDANVATSETLSNNNAIAIISRENSSIIDGVCWGNLDASKVNYCEGNSFVKIFANISIGRINSSDSDENVKDFFLLKEDSPGKENEKLEEKPVEPKIYPKGIIFSEIYPKPYKDVNNYEEGYSEEYKKEFIELFNSSEIEISLDGWEIVDYGKHVCKLDGKKISAGKLLVIKDIPDGDCDLELNDTGNETVSLKNPSKDTVFEVSYSSAKEGKSYNFDGANWRWSKFLTPGKENVFNNQPYGTLQIDENVFLNVYADFSVSTGDVDGDAVKVVWNFGDEHKSYLAKTRHKYEKIGTYAGSVKLSDTSEDVIKNFTIEVVEIPHPKVKITSIDPNPAGVDSGNESLTILNKSKKKINLLGWSIATGWKNKLVNHPIREDVIIKAGKEKEIKSDVSSFTLNNAKAKIQLRYPDGEVAYEVKYKSKEKSITEGEIYQKTKDGWEWTNSQKSIKSIKFINQEDGVEEVSESSVISNQSSNDKKDDGEVAGVEDMKRKIKLFENNDLKNIKIFKNETHLTGAKSFVEIDGKYVFTKNDFEQKHYAVFFLKEALLMINLRVSAFLNYLK